MPTPHYHAEVTSNQLNAHTVLGVDLRSYRGEYVIDLTVWRDTDPMQKEWSAGVLTPEEARYLGRHLISAADAAQNDQ